MGFLYIGFVMIVIGFRFLCMGFGIFLCCVFEGFWW